MAKKRNDKDIAKTLIRLGIFGYIFVMFITCHVAKVDFSDLEAGPDLLMQHILHQPLDIFPINWTAVGLVSFVCFLIAAGCQVSYEKQKSTRPGEESGSAKWNEDFGRFAQKYAEPLGKKEIEQKTGWLDKKTLLPWKGSKLKSKPAEEKKTKSIFVALSKLVRRKIDAIRRSIKERWLDFKAGLHKDPVVDGEDEVKEPSALQVKMHSIVCDLEERLDMDLERYKPKACVAAEKRLKEQAEREARQRDVDGAAAALRRRTRLAGPAPREKMTATLVPVNRNMILSQNVALSMDGRATRKNCNTLILGGSGAGKTRFYLKPNLMQLNCSYVITDPSGEILQSMGTFLRNAGYEIKVINLTNMDQSHCYNPFSYVREDADILVMIDVLTKNLTPPDSHSSDPFWPKSQAALLQAICFFLYKECRPSERNFTNVMKLLRAAIIKEGNDDYKSPLDIIFEDLEKRDPNHIAVMQYSIFKQAPAKTASTILTCAQVDLAPFNLDTIANLTGVDTLHMETIGQKPTALFCITPTAKTTYNWIISLAYTQLFETLYYIAETQCKGLRLPVHVRFLLDEFANIGQIPDFEQKLSTMRKYEISCAIIIQNMAQLETMYKDSWKTIVGNCDEFIYLGGHESSSTEYVSKMLGKQTIKSKNSSKTYGRQGSSNISLNATGRELMTPDEIAHMSDQDCLVMIKGVMPFFDQKYDLLKHPNYQFTGDADDALLFDVAAEIRTPQNNVFGKKSQGQRRKLEEKAKSDTRVHDRRTPVGRPEKSPLIPTPENLAAAGLLTESGEVADIEVTAANVPVGYEVPPDIEVESAESFDSFLSEEPVVEEPAVEAPAPVEESFDEIVLDGDGAVVPAEDEMDDVPLDAEAIGVYDADMMEAMAAEAFDAFLGDTEEGEEAVITVPEVEVDDSVPVSDTVLHGSARSCFTGHLKPLNGVSFAVLHAAATGLDVDDEIVELAIVDRDGTVLYTSLFQTQKELSPAAAAKSGLDAAALSTAPRFEDEWAKIKGVLGDKRTIMFNSEHERTLFVQTLMRYDLDAEELETVLDGCLDARSMYLDIRPSSRRRVSLQVCCNALGMDAKETYRALPDCLTTLELLRGLDGVKETPEAPMRYLEDMLRPM